MQLVLPILLWMTAFDFSLETNNVFYPSPVEDPKFGNYTLRVTTQIVNNEVTAVVTGLENEVTDFQGFLTALNADMLQIFGESSDHRKLLFKNLEYGTQYKADFSITLRGMIVLRKSTFIHTDGDPLTTPTNLRPVFIGIDGFSVAWDPPSANETLWDVHYLVWNDTETCENPASVDFSLDHPTVGTTSLIQIMSKSRVKMWISLKNAQSRSAPLSIGLLDNNNDGKIESLLINRSMTDELQLNIWFSQTWESDHGSDVVAVTHDGCGVCDYFLLFRQGRQASLDVSINVTAKLCTRQDPVAVHMLDLSIIDNYGVALLPETLAQTVLSQRMSVFTLESSKPHKISDIQEFDVLSAEKMHISWRPPLRNLLLIERFVVTVEDMKSQCTETISIGKEGTGLEIGQTPSNPCRSNDLPMAVFRFTEESLFNVASSTEKFFAVSFSPSSGSEYRLTLVAEGRNLSSKPVMRTVSPLLPLDVGVFIGLVGR